MIAAIPLTFIIAIYTFFSFKKPGIVLSFVFFFQVISNIIFLDLNLFSIRYVLLIYLLVLFLVFNFNVVSFKKNVFADAIVLGIALLILAMVFHLYVKGGVADKGNSLFIKFLVPNLILILIALLFLNESKFFRQISEGIIISGIIFFILLFLLVDSGEITTTNRMSVIDAIELSPIALGRIAAMIAIVSIVWGLAHETFYVKAVSIINILLSMYWMFLASSRGVLISLLIVLVIYGLIKSKSIKKLAINFSILIGIVVVAFWILSIAKFTVVERFYELENYEEMQRYVGYLAAWNIFLDNYLVGVGPSGYFALTGREYPHNLILELLSEYGAFGILCSLLIVPNCFRYVYKILTKTNYTKEIESLALLWVFFFISAMFSGYISSNREFWILSAILVSIVNSRYSTKFSKSIERIRINFYLIK